MEPTVSNVASIDRILTLIFGVLSVVGLALTIYYGRKSARLERERVTLNWSDMQIAVDDLARDISAAAFSPDIFLAPGSRGGIIAHLLSQELGDNRPVVVGVTLWKESFPMAPVLPMYEMLETNKWFVGIPTALLENMAQKILIVDDFAMSGDAIERICTALRARGYPKENIRTATVIVTDVAIRNKKAPDFYWKQTESTQFFFPWGRAR